MEHPPPIPLRFDAPRIMFGAGRFAELGSLTAGFGRRVCLVTGGRSLAQSGNLEKLFAQFKAAGLEHIHLTVSGEPTVELVDELAAQARDFKAEVVVGVGGGSVLDAGKAVSALLTNSGRAQDYLEGVGTGAQLTARARPFIAAPTTAGTGSEATKNAVLGDRARTFKKSMRSDSMLPAVALVDPELTYDCPAAITAACGMDAVVQLIESHASARATAAVRSLAHSTLYEITDLPHLVESPQDPDAPKWREVMAWAGLQGGVCLANAGLGAVHGIASPLGAHFDIPHGPACAALLPAVIRGNARRAAESERRDYHFSCEFVSQALDPLEYATIEEAPETLAAFFQGWLARMKLPGLAHYGVTPADFPRIIAGARGNSMKTNPVELTDEDLREILEASL